MIDYTQSFMKLLQASGDALQWAVQQVPGEQVYTVSQRRPESWSVARNILHVQYYEEHVVLPCMCLWLADEHAEGYKSEDAAQIARYKDYETLAYDEEMTWKQAPDVETLLERFQTFRSQQINLLPQFAPEAWEEKRKAVWGKVTLRWVVTKTYQHTLEHINEILKHALFGTGLRA
ncbi:MAG TPA: DinB family protein [Ktedonobacteraceae bacterium]|nr:DinB family protein [Ktedonobacteraceae bacterium]